MATTTAIILYRGQGIGVLAGQRLLAVGGLLNPVGFVPEVHSDYNFPASPWGRSEFRSSSLRPETRRQVSKALHEATLEEEEPKPKKKRRPKPVAPPPEIIDEPDSPAPEAISRNIGELPSKPAPQAVVRPAVAGHGSLRGQHLEPRCGALTPSGGAVAALKSKNRRARAGRLRASGIQNLSEEQLVNLLLVA